MRSLELLLAVLLLAGCTAHLNPQVEQKRSAELYRVIMRQVPGADPSESRRIARESILYSVKLSQKYKVSTPALVHNFLVNIGAKKRGLCYQWSDDLYTHLKQYRIKSMTLKPVGAFIGSYWREHNALALLPKGVQSLDQGVLLDPWRESGRLYFTAINNDPEYHWQIRNDRCGVYGYSTQNGK